MPRQGSFVGPLIGRKRELQVLQLLLDGLESGAGGVVLIGGESGVGKTRLSQETADIARSRGFAIAWGRHTESPSARICGAWIDILSSLPSSSPLPDADLSARERGGAYPGESGPRAEHQTETPTDGLSSRDEEIRLIDAVGRSLTSFAKTQPLVLILDDLHWADSVGLELFCQVARAAGDCPMLLLATYRDTELGPAHPLSRVMAVVRRDRHVHHLPIRTLSIRETRELALSLAPSIEIGAWAEAIWKETTGNPFLAEELTRHLSEAGAFAAPPPTTATGYDLQSLGVPEAIRQVITLRTARLSQDAGALLTAGCVASGGFNFDTLQSMTGMDDDRLLNALDDVLNAHLIILQPGQRETYQFVHDIAREALYSNLSPSRRVRLHRRMAEALMQSSSSMSVEHAAEVAIQFHASSTLAGASAGIEYALIAAGQAEERAAREQAVAFLRIARDLAGTESPERQIAVLLRLAVAEANALDLDATKDVIRSLKGALAVDGTSEVELAPLFWKIASALKDGGADGSEWGGYVEQGLQCVSSEDNLSWARLTLLKERFESVSSEQINAARWLGNDPLAQEIARTQGSEDDFARTLQPFEHYDIQTTEALVERITAWNRPTAIIRGLTITGAYWLYHLAEFRRSRHHFLQLLAVSERFGSIIGQAESHIRLAIVACAFGELTVAQDEAAQARELLTRLLPNHRLHTSLAWVDAYLAEYLGGDWKSIADTLTRVVEDPRTGRRSIGLDDAALAALALARSGQNESGRRMLSTLSQLIPAVDSSTALANGAVAFGASAVWALDVPELAPVFLQASERLMAAGVRSFPCSSLELSAARMASLSSEHTSASIWFERARTRLEAEGQRPLRAIADLDEARILAKLTGESRRIEQLQEFARATFQSLGMDEWAAFSYISIPKERKLATSFAANRPGGLTQREVEVLKLVSRGNSDRQISSELYLSPRTVNAHIRNMLSKTRSSNRTELSVWAMRNVFIDPIAGEQN